MTESGVPTSELRRMVAAEVASVDRTQIKVLLTLVNSDMRSRSSDLCEWLSLLSEFVSPRGHAFLVVKSEYEDSSMLRPDWILEILPEEWMLRDVVILERMRWVDSPDVPLRRRYDFLLWYVLSQTGYDFNLDPVRVPNVTGDKRNHPKGKNPGNVWLRNRRDVTSTLYDFAGRRQKKSPWAPRDGVALGEEFARRILLSTMDRGELVVDPLGSLPELPLLAEKAGLQSLAMRLPHVRGGIS